MVGKAFKFRKKLYVIKIFKEIYFWFRSKDRLIFPFWLLFQCVIRRKRAVVIKRIDALGDVVCTLPTCADLRNKFPSTFVVLVTSFFCVRMARLSPQVDAVYGATSSTIKIPKGFFGLVRESLIAETLDSVSNSGATEHLIDDLGRSCGVVLSDRQPRLTAPDALRERVRIKIKHTEGRHLITINPGPTWPIRNWPAAYWQEVVDTLHSKLNCQIFMLGGSRRGTQTPYDLLLGVFSLAGTLRSDELTALIALSHLVISIDSGPIHIAGAVGTPVVGLFGAVNPALRLPLNSPSIGVHADLPCLFCHHRTPIGHWITGCPNDVACMTALKPSTVIEAAFTLLNRPKTENENP